MEREKIKLLVVGCPKSGKSALIHRYNTDEFVAGQANSHGDLVIKTVSFNDNDLSVHIWELEDKQSDNQSFYNDTDGLILVSDVTSIDSVVGLNDLYNKAKKHLGITDNTFPVAVVANKIDHKDADAMVALSGLKRWATGIWPNMPSNLFFVETSVKDNIHVKEVFDHMIHYVYHSSKNKFATPSKTGTNLMNSIYGNPLNNRRASAVKTTETSFSPSNDLSHLQHQRQQQQIHQQQQQQPVVTASPPAATEEQYFDDNCTVNIVVAGSCYSGKTAVVSRFMGDSNIFTAQDSHQYASNSNKRVNYQYEPTIGVDFRTYTDMVVDEMNLKLQIWDSSGNPAMRSVARAIYRDADGLILVYDISSEESFLALDGYLQDFLAVRDTPEDFVALLVGNKSDLSDKRAVPMERVLEWCAQKREIKPLSYIECSALSGAGIKDVFVLASDEVCDYLFEDEDEYTDTDYDDTNDVESESDEESQANYTDISVHEEDFTAVSLPRMNSHNKSTMQDNINNNFNNDSVSEVVSELSQAKPKRPRSKKRFSGRLNSGDISAMLNSEMEAAKAKEENNSVTATSVSTSAEAAAASSSSSAAGFVNPLYHPHTAGGTAEVPNSKLPANEVRDSAQEASSADTTRDGASVPAIERTTSGIGKKKKLRKTRSELNDESIISQLVRASGGSTSTNAYERTCWTDLWTTFNCVINPEPAPMVMAESIDDSKSTESKL